MVARWTPEMLDALRTLYRRLPAAACAEALNARFGVALSAAQVRSAVGRHRIRCGRDGRFRPGQRPWNAGLTGVLPARETSFRPGQKPPNTYPVGAYRFVEGTGWLLKVRESQRAGQARHDWEVVSHLTYLAHHGPIPDGHVVLLLDGDAHNCLDPDNLVAIPRAVLARLNRGGFRELPPDRAVRLAAVAEALVLHAAHQRAAAIGLGTPAKRRALLPPAGRYAPQEGA